MPISEGVGQVEKNILLASKKFSNPRPIGIVVALIPVIGIAIFVSGIAMGFWGIWYAIAGYIPTFLGFSRFYLDTFSVGVYAVIAVVYVSALTDNLEELSEDEDHLPINLQDFFREFPGFTVLSGFMILNFIASIFFSFATGLALFAILAICYYGYRGVKKLGGFLLAIVWFYGRALGICDTESVDESD